MNTQVLLYLSSGRAGSICKSELVPKKQGIVVLHLTVEEMSDLKSSVAALENVLEKLDRIGAGIAAIHVDAAIGQLKNNLEVIAAENWQIGEIAQTCPSEYPLVSR